MNMTKRFFGVFKLGVADRTMWRLVLLLTSAFVLALTPRPSTAAVIGDVLCLQQIADVPNNYRFTFGYENTDTSPTLLLPGPNNYFTPGPGNLGQLTNFFPGEVAQAFRLDFDFSVESSFFWELQSQLYLVSTNVRQCPPELAKPITKPQLITGNNQTATVNTNFAAPLKVLVISTLDGSPLNGVDVRFYVPPTGASASVSTTVATTDINGVASVTAMANALAGSYTIYAVVATREYATPTVSAKFLLVNQ